MYYLLGLITIGGLSAIIYSHCKKESKKFRRIKKRRLRDNLKYIEKDYITKKIDVENIV